MVSTRASCSFFFLRDSKACCRRFSAMSWRASSTSRAIREKICAHQVSAEGLSGCADMADKACQSRAYPAAPQLSASSSESSS